jgi:pilus assembly protein Flp/PilA
VIAVLTRAVGAAGQLAAGTKGDKFMQFVRKMIKDNKGATAIEYGLIAALIAVAAITAMQGLGTQLNKTFNNVTASMKVS